MPNIPLSKIEWEQGTGINKIAVLNQPFFCYGVVAFARKTMFTNCEKIKIVKLHREGRTSAAWLGRS